MKPSPTAEDRMGRAILWVVAIVVTALIACGVFVWVIGTAIFKAVGLL